VNVTCPECASVFRVDPAKVPYGGIKARCAVCEGVISVPGSPQEQAAAAVVPTAVAAAVPPVAASRVPETALPPRRTNPPLVPPVGLTPPTGGSLRPAGFFVAPPTGGGVRSTPSMIPPAVSPPPVVAPARATPASSADGVAPARHVNPFVANDPNAKARRLARALVSDMIAYRPQQREEGLRDGTLTQIFREDIKKSYKQYVNQIGTEVAESTNHFADALNDILAGGQRMF
jgi:predicted Zn finger-like uncharacterized protein